VREVFLILTGLNFHPARLEPWEALFTAHGAATLQPALRGYAAPGDPAWRHVNAGQWLDDVSTAHEQMAGRFPGAAVSMFGYSTGGVLGLVWSRRSKVPLRRAVLLAPALAQRPLPRAAIALLALLPGPLLLPSKAPRAYRMHDATSVAAYTALRHLVAEFRRGGGSAPRAVFLCISRRDELVSVAAAERYLGALRGLRPQGQDRLHWLDFTPRPHWLHHLGVDRFTMGEQAWQRLQGELEVWLEAALP
jgi:esterase/lipase